MATRRQRGRRGGNISIPGAASAWPGKIQSGIIVAHLGMASGLDGRPRLAAAILRAIGRFLSANHALCLNRRPLQGEAMNPIGRENARVCARRER